MSFELRPAKREGLYVLAGLAGASGSGKTLSAMLLAQGLAGGKRFAVIDTEAGRALHYADDFDFDHGDLEPPFTPQRYAEAIKAVAKKKYPVIVVDSASHEYAGEGGILDWHDAELTRMAGEDWKKREAMTFAAWVKPKAEHKRFVNQLLQLRCHIILCLRAEEKIELVKKNGKLEVVPKRTAAGHVGWIPVAEKNLPYELTVSLVVTPDEPGIPKPIKLQQQHKPFFPLDKPITAAAGEALAAWAAGKEVGGEPKKGRGRAHPQAEPDADASPVSPDPLVADEPASPLATPAKKKKLDVLVGKLRDGGHITTEALYRRCRIEPEPTDYHEDDGHLMWRTLRDRLTDKFAAGLIESLAKLEAGIERAAAADTGDDAADEQGSFFQQVAERARESA